MLALWKLPVLGLQGAVLLLIVPTLPLFWLAGFLGALLIRLTPTIDAKVLVARTLVSTPFLLVSRELAWEIGQEVEWIVRKRYDKDELRGMFAKLLDVAWEDPDKR